MQRNVTIAGPSAIFGLNAKDRGAGKEKNTKGTVTWVVFITAFMALSKTLKLWDKVCFQFEMSDSALCLCVDVVNSTFDLQINGKVTYITHLNTPTYTHPPTYT